MSFDAIKSGVDSLSSRFLLVNFLPAVVGVLSLAVVVLAGAPGQTLDWVDAWRRITGAGAGTVATVGFVVLVVALMLRPLQLLVVRVFEGHWPGWLRPVATVRRAAHRRHRDRLRAAADRLPDNPHTPGVEGMVQAAGRAGTLLRQRYPVGPRLLPTAMGNTLAAAEETAGAAYGFDAVVAWPKLYPLLPQATKQIVDDRRNTLDAAVAMAATMAVVGVGGAVLLVGSGWWLLLVLVPWTLAAVAYRGAVETAVAYGEAIDAAFELHRFSLYTALRQAPPVDHAAEVRLARRLCLQWRQGVVDPSAPPYLHPSTPDAMEA